MKEPLLISACLLGENCKYNGGNNRIPEADALGERYDLIPVCPECQGGLPTPRVPAERRGGRVLTQDGRDVTAEYRLGAEIALRTAREKNCTKALLKERSPSCGQGRIYDGSFTHTQVEGDGVAAELLGKNGLTIYGESRVSELLK